jgi:uncharacterized surface protein with fasciclin (FAS1) repeats
MNRKSSYQKISLFAGLASLSFLITLPLMANPIRPGYSMWQRPIAIFESEQTVSLADQLNAEGFETLVSALEKTGLMKELRLSGKCSIQNPCTLFAPTNEAFNNLSFEESVELSKPEVLKKVIQYHLVSYELNGEDAVGEITTVSGENITITQSKRNPNEFWVNDEVRLTPNDNGDSPIIFVDNGMIIAIDQVLFPTESQW